MENNKPKNVRDIAIKALCAACCSENDWKRCKNKTPHRCWLKNEFINKFNEGLNVAND